MKDRELSKSIIYVLTHDAGNTPIIYKQIAAVLGIKDPYVRKELSVTLLDQLKKMTIR